MGQRSNSQCHFKSSFSKGPTKSFTGAKDRNTSQVGFKKKPELEILSLDSFEIEEKRAEKLAKEYRQ